MEPIEYRTVAQTGSLARMLERLNELGDQGWEVCAQASARTDLETVGRVAPRHEVLLLKRHKGPDAGKHQRRQPGNDTRRGLDPASAPRGARPGWILTVPLGRVP